MELIVTGANTNHYHFLKLFVQSLRTNGKYTGKIVVCDNSIEGKWDQPGKFLDITSFSEEQLAFLESHDVEIMMYHELIKSNNCSREVIDKIPSYTQRYPHKYVYTTLISKMYMDTVDYICFFDADIYFQKPVRPLFDAMKNGGIHMVKEYVKIGKSPFLKKWIAHSDFSSLSDQKRYEQQMFGSEDFCTGFFGGRADEFHKLTLLALLLTSNQFVEFYSDQPLMNILKSFFHYPIHEISDEYVMHLGELPKEELVVKDQMVHYKGSASIAVHFNGGTKDFFDQIVEGHDYATSLQDKLFVKGKRVVGYLRKVIKI